MENTLVIRTCLFFSKNSIVSAFDKICAVSSTFKKIRIQSIGNKRFARISARQMLCSSILLRVYGERLLPLGFLFLILFEAGFIPAFFVAMYAHKEVN